MLSESFTTRISISKKRRSCAASGRSCMAVTLRGTRCRQSGERTCISWAMKRCLVACRNQLRTQSRQGRAFPPRPQQWVVPRTPLAPGPAQLRASRASTRARNDAPAWGGGACAGCQWNAYAGRPGAHRAMRRRAPPCRHPGGPYCRPPRLLAAAPASTPHWPPLRRRRRRAEVPGSCRCHVVPRDRWAKRGRTHAVWCARRGARPAEANCAPANWPASPDGGSSVALYRN